MMLYGDIEIFAFVLLFWIIYETFRVRKDANYVMQIVPFKHAGKTRTSKAKFGRR